MAIGKKGISPLLGTELGVGLAIFDALSGFRPVVIVDSAAATFAQLRKSANVARGGCPLLVS